MAWVESHSASFTARHEDADAGAVAHVLDELEGFRERLEARFERAPGEVVVVVHRRWPELALGQPWLPLAWLATAPAARRYLTGWFATGQIHVLSPRALERRASALPESREAVRLAPLHEYAHLVVGANNRQLPPPFSPRTFRRYLRWAWLCEGAATYLSGQSELLRPAIVRRLREGPAPTMPPAARDAQLLGGSVFSLLADERGDRAAVDLAARLDPAGPEAGIERAFEARIGEVQLAWRSYLAELAYS